MSKTIIRSAAATFAAFALACAAAPAPAPSRPMLDTAMAPLEAPSAVVADALAYGMAVLQLPAPVLQTLPGWC